MKTSQIQKLLKAKLNNMDMIEIYRDHSVMNKVNEKWKSNSIISKQNTFFAQIGINGQITDDKNTLNLLRKQVKGLLILSFWVKSKYSDKYWRVCYVEDIVWNDEREEIQFKIISTDWDGPVNVNHFNKYVVPFKLNL